MKLKQMLKIFLHKVKENGKVFNEIN